MFSNIKNAKRFNTSPKRKRVWIYRVEVFTRLRFGLVLKLNGQPLREISVSSNFQFLAPGLHFEFQLNFNETNLLDWRRAGAF